MNCTRWPPGRASRPWRADRLRKPPLLGVPEGAGGARVVGDVQVAPQMGEERRVLVEGEADHVGPQLLVDLVVDRARLARVQLAVGLLEEAVDLGIGVAVEVAGSGGAARSLVGRGVVRG